MATAGYRPNSGIKRTKVLPATGTGAINQDIQRIIFTNPCLAEQLCRIIIMKRVAYCTGTRCFSWTFIFLSTAISPLWGDWLNNSNFYR
jgi:hypothetical protein